MDTNIINNFEFNSTLKQLNPTAQFEHTLSIASKKGYAKQKFTGQHQSLDKKNEDK